MYGPNIPSYKHQDLSRTVCICHTHKHTGVQTNTHKHGKSFLKKSFITRQRLKVFKKGQFKAPDLQKA